MERDPDQFEANKKNTINCEICHVDFPSHADLYKHQSILHGSARGYLCNVCSFVANTEKSLKYHQQNHEKGAKFQCEIFYQICSYKSQLLRHTRYKHTYEKPYKCKYCSFASVEKHKLNDHLKVHTGELNFECKTCKKSFRNNISLKLHEDIHKERMEWVCVLCFGEFRKADTLRIHMNGVHLVESIHRGIRNSSKENGLPETLKMYINTLGLQEEEVMKDRIVRYYAIQPEYTHCYSEYFKNLSPIIYHMESNRKNIICPEETTEKFKSGGRIPDRLFLQNPKKQKAVPASLKRTSKKNEKVVHDKRTTEESKETGITGRQDPPFSVKNNCIKLTSELEDKKKRRNLLVGMKRGKFGQKPHVIKVLVDGTIIDCTENYKTFLP